MAASPSPLPTVADLVSSARFRLVSKRPLLHSLKVNNSERITDFIRRFPGRDDDEISAALQIEPRQTVNQVCRSLAKAGLVERRPNPTGKLGNYPFDGPSINRAAPSSEAEASGAEAVPDATKEWFWEGNVTDAVARYLGEQGWRIFRKPTHERKSAA